MLTSTGRRLKLVVSLYAVVRDSVIILPDMSFLASYCSGLPLPSAGFSVRVYSLSFDVPALKRWKLAFAAVIRLVIRGVNE